MEKTYSRVVRKLAQTLVGWGVASDFMHHPIDIASQMPVQTIVSLADIIERALQGETIKRSELNALKQSAEHNKIDADYYFTAWMAALDWEVRSASQVLDLKNKLWAAEQEIHDLKEALEDDQKDIETLANALIDAKVKEPEQIEIPSCLKPHDALRWFTDMVVYQPYTGTPVPQSTWTISSSY